jgi:excinuclease UvrABC ATPase subunit
MGRGGGMSGDCPTCFGCGTLVNKVGDIGLSKPQCPDCKGTGATTEIIELRYRIRVLEAQIAEDHKHFDAHVLQLMLDKEALTVELALLKTKPKEIQALGEGFGFIRPW